MQDNCAVILKAGAVDMAAGSEICDSSNWFLNGPAHAVIARDPADKPVSGPSKPSESPFGPCCRPP